MVDKSAPDAPPDATAGPPVPPKRSPGHRGAEVKDTVAEMAAKAHEISLEAGSKMAAAMKDVVNAAAGLTGFVLESARDLVQYMVRRGQMTQEEADKLIRQAEDAQVGRPKVTPPAKSAEKPAPVEKAAPAHVPVVEHKPIEEKTAEPEEAEQEEPEPASQNPTAKKDSEKSEKPAPAKKAAAKTAPAAKKAAPKKK